MAENIMREPIRLGMVGGGIGAMVGAIHRYAMRLDGGYSLVAGALSAEPDRARLSAAEIGIADERSYVSYNEMAAAEAARADGIEALVIVTPNHLHLPVAKPFLEAGIHVICDKPLAASLDDAKAMAAAARRSSALFFLTHNYSAYPMVREARHLARSGALGQIRIIQAEYAQDWLTEPIERDGQKQAQWRTDPAMAGGGAIGDIGTHAYQLIDFVTGLVPRALSADLSSFVPGRRVDDNAHILLRFDGGAKAMLWVSQVAPGHQNGLRLRLYGDRAGLEWAQESPEELWLAPFGEAKKRLVRGGAETGSASLGMGRTPGGHPAGFIEGFANLYAEIAEAIIARRNGDPVPDGVLVPGVEDGLKGARFVDACQRSSAEDAAWIQL